mmetsp:Transcript_24350/g.54255  ORF Transcript_24350/g.54255 Transcript_24350/m.54255 type:complete len:201 (-) Transcript_24350:258-860(-)
MTPSATVCACGHAAKATRKSASAEADSSPHWSQEGDARKASAHRSPDQRTRQEAKGRQSVDGVVPHATAPTQNAASLEQSARPLSRRKAHLAVGGTRGALKGADWTGPQRRSGTFITKAQQIHFGCESMVSLPNWSSSIEICTAKLAVRRSLRVCVCTTWASSPRFGGAAEERQCGAIGPGRAWRWPQKTPGEERLLRVL